MKHKIFLVLIFILSITAARAEEFSPLKITVRGSKASDEELWLSGCVCRPIDEPVSMTRFFDAEHFLVIQKPKLVEDKMAVVTDETGERLVKVGEINTYAHEDALIQVWADITGVPKSKFKSERPIFRLKEKYLALTFMDKDRLFDTFPDNISCWEEIESMDNYKPRTKYLKELKEYYKKLDDSDQWAARLTKTITSKKDLMVMVLMTEKLETESGFLYKAIKKASSDALKIYRESNKK